jgi:signal transduction histidine kinase
LSIVLLDVVFDSFYGFYVISFDLWVMIAGVTIFTMAFFAFIWLQNIIARFKCRSFLRYSEFYYGRKFLKWCWIKWKCLWNKITTPFRVVMELIRDNTKLFTRGLVIMLGISFVEFLFIIWLHHDIDMFLMFFVLEKIIELVIITFVLLQMQKLQDGSKRIAAGDLSNPIDTKKMFWEFKKHGENINKVSEGISLAVEERMKSERFKTELITNVSHDIKTPLTSIINYVDLIKKQDV